MVIIRTGFTRMADNDLLDDTQTIITDMTAAVLDYPTPVPSVASVQTAKNEFETAKADKGTPAKTAFKNEKRAAMIVLLNSLALYVQANCGNDPAKALRSGYKIRKQRTPVGDLPKPTDFKVGPGKNTQEVSVSMKSYREKAKSYMYRFSQLDGTDPETWQSLPSSRPKTFIKGLISGRKVFVQGAGVGASKHLVWSDVISVYVM